MNPNDLVKKLDLVLLEQGKKDKKKSGYEVRTH